MTESGGGYLQRTPRRLSLLVFVQRARLHRDVIFPSFLATWRVSFSPRERNFKNMFSKSLGQLHSIARSVHSCRTFFFTLECFLIFGRIHIYIRCPGVWMRRMFHEIDCFPFNPPFSLGVDRRTANELSSAQWTFLFVSRQQWRLFCSLAVGPRTGRMLGVGYCHVIDETRASPCRRRSLFRDVLPLPHHSGDRLVRPSLPLSPARGCVDVVRPGCRAPFTVAAVARREFHYYGGNSLLLLLLGALRWCGALVPPHPVRSPARAHCWR